jgi:hypothetical protein
VGDGALDALQKLNALMAGNESVVAPPDHDEYYLYEG